MRNYWSGDDKLFVDEELEVLSFNLSFASSAFESLPMERRSDFVYDGPKGDDFKGFLSKMGYHVNRKGRVIVAVQGGDKMVEAFHYFLLDKVVPLGPFGFPNPPLPTWKEVMELQSLLDNSKSELAKKNDELNESRKQLESIKAELMDKITVMKKEVMKSQNLLKETEAELAKKNYQVSESQRQLEDSKTALMKLKVNPQLAKFSPSRVLGDLNDIFEFLRRMNGTYVNSKGIYLKFDFIGAKSSGSWVTSDNSFHYYYTEEFRATNPFSLVQFDWNKHAMDIQERRVLLPQIKKTGCHIDTQWNTEDLDKDDEVIALTFKEFCFIGKIKKVSDTFFENALVSVFFEQSKHDKNYCFVDALATTFVVFKTKDLYCNLVSRVEIPRFIS